MTTLPQSDYSSGVTSYLGTSLEMTLVDSLYRLTSSRAVDITTASATARLFLDYEG